MFDFQNRPFFLSASKSQEMFTDLVFIRLVLSYDHMTRHARMKLYHFIVVCQTSSWQTFHFTYMQSKYFAVVCGLFIRCVQSNIVLLTQAFRKKFVIPDFQAFTSHIDDLYENSRTLSGGQVCLQIHHSTTILFIHLSF